LFIRTEENVRLPAAYISIVLIWSTTSLALKWSAEAGVLAAVLGRMGITVALAGLLAIVLGRRLLLHAAAVQLYLVGGISTFGTLMLICWGSRFIPAGWISVIFGLTPILTSVLGAVFLNERHVSARRIGALLLSLAGLAVMFGEGTRIGPDAGWGIAANVLATLLYAGNLVWTKRLNASVDSLASMTGTFFVGLLLCEAAWALTGGDATRNFTVRSGAAILYLGVVGSIVGYTLFYYLLRHLDTTRIAIISLMTPVTSLLVGHVFNAEPLTAAIWTGTALVTLGLVWFEYGTVVAPLLAAARNRLVRTTPSPGA
jgi:drug/metabolite transporter (DMT)-like permease